MVRPLRLEYTGALYHLTARGDGREDVFLNDADRQHFLVLLGKVRARFNWAIHAYCLMNNHYHLLVETPDANLARGMRQLNGVYTQDFNRTHDRVGHVFQGRYKAIVVEKESYLVELARYVVLNPVRAGLVGDPGEWPWSSYRATVGAPEQAPDWLERQWILSAFGETEGEAIAAYVGFVADGIGRSAPWKQLRHQLLLGSDGFVDALRSKVPAGVDLSEVPQARQRPTPRPLAEIASRFADRDRAIAAAYASGGYTMKEIGEHFGLHYSRVSRIVRLADQAPAEPASSKSQDLTPESA
ncbi:REP-associated tyrosine transposase [Accumulibacter sp.]|uniref:REP-associated tyrosine transposase n=1 Tax=Accumulibacter sp. TaxID=2053492 RepID=UPI0025F7A964|nr:transposase [Accumulibacter sp.]MCM8594778.1 transposase [Accumulibacter sp.]MCM8625117.1 transposase [Accumulibacter sp.]MDS4048923.1 transposase [Accumulibacter sp.]